MSIATDKTSSMTDGDVHEGLDGYGIIDRWISVVNL